MSALLSPQFRLGPGSQRHLPHFLHSPPTDTTVQNRQTRSFAPQSVQQNVRIGGPFGQTKQVILFQALRGNKVLQAQASEESHPPAALARRPCEVNILTVCK